MDEIKKLAEDMFSFAMFDMYSAEDVFSVLAERIGQTPRRSGSA